MSGTEAKTVGYAGYRHAFENLLGDIEASIDRYEVGTQKACDLLSERGMMDYTYEADVERTEDGWLVTFPAFPGAYGGGRTIGKACRDAAEALRMAIAQTVSERGKLPKPRFRTHPGAIFTVQVDGEYIKDTGSVPATEAARLLGVSKARVSQLVKDGKLETVNVGGRSKVTLASINARKATR